MSGGVMELLNILAAGGAVLVVMGLFVAVSILIAAWLSSLEMFWWLTRNRIGDAILTVLVMATILGACYGLGWTVTR